VPQGFELPQDVLRACGICPEIWVGGLGF